MIVPTIVKERWVVPPTSIETLETNLSETKADLQTTQTELADAKTDLEEKTYQIISLEARLAALEQKFISN
jgi:septal ring factor EnvC (AmiA/AmiB activator)